MFTSQNTPRIGVCEWIELIVAFLFLKRKGKIEESKFILGPININPNL